MAAGMAKRAAKKARQSVVDPSRPSGKNVHTATSNLFYTFIRFHLRYLLK